MGTRYEVIVGNVGVVYSGDVRREARAVYQTSIGFSKRNRGRAGGEPVTMLQDGELYCEYEPSLHLEDTFEAA